MPFPDPANGEVVFKIVYAGAEGAGKRTSLAAVHRALGASCEQAVATQTACDETILFNYRPLPAVHVGGLKARFRILTVSGAARYAATLQLALRGLDGLVFVADSAPTKLDRNLLALKEVRKALQHNNRATVEPPAVLQCNKCDLSNAESLANLRRSFAAFFPAARVVESCATTGQGVLAALEELSAAMFAGGASRPQPPPATTQIQASAQAGQ